MNLVLNCDAGQMKVLCGPMVVRLDRSASQPSVQAVHCSARGFVTIDKLAQSSKNWGRQST